MNERLFFFLINLSHLINIIRIRVDEHLIRCIFEQS